MYRRRHSRSASRAQESQPPVWKLPSGLEAITKPDGPIKAHARAAVGQALNLVNCDSLPITCEPQWPCFLSRPELPGCFALIIPIFFAQ
jgi:hypothetical protein